MRPPKKLQSALRTPLNRILGTEANVRVLRAVCLDQSPMSRTELGRRAHLEPKGAHLAARRLIDEGMLRFVGKGSRQQVTLNPQHPLALDVQQLFQREREGVENFLGSLKKVIQDNGVEIIGAWIQGHVANGQDRPGEPVVLGVLGHSPTLGSLVKRLRKELSAVEASYDKTIEVVAYSRPDLDLLSPAKRRELSEILLLFGIPPMIDEREHKTYTVLRNAVMHGDRDLQQLMLARLVGEKLLRDPGRIEEAKRSLRKRIETASPHERETLQEWLLLLETMSESRLKRFLESGADRAVRLRQSLPFLDVLTPREREEVLLLSRTT